MPILFVICDSTPTSHIKVKFNILFFPIQIWKIATVPAWFKILYQRNSTPLSYKFNIFLDPTQTNYKIVPTCFANLHQHPTLYQNWIYLLVQYTKIYCNSSYVKCVSKPTFYIDAKINIIFWTNTNKKKCNSANTIRDS